MLGKVITRSLGVLVCVLALGAGLTAQNTTWTGSYSNLWDDAGNWSNGVPDSSLNAIIAPSSNTPTTAGASLPTCLNLTVRPAATLDVAAATTLTVGGTAQINGSVTGNGTCRFTGNGTITAFSGPGGAGGPSLPSVEITSPGYTINAIVTGNLLQTAGASDLVLDAVTVQGNATFEGGTFSQLANASLDVQGHIAIRTVSPVTDAPSIFCAGNWISNGNFQPASGTVIFDGTAPQAITGPDIAWVNLEVRPSASISTIQDVITTGALTVDGALTTTGTALEVGTDLSIAGSLVANSVPTLRVFGGITNSGTLSATSALLDVDGSVVFGAASSTAIADGTHTFSSGLEANGTLTVPPTSTFVFDGSGGGIAGSTFLPNVRVMGSGYGIAARVTGDLLQAASAANLLILNATSVQGNATFEGGTFSQLENNASLEVEGDLAIQTASAVTDVPATIQVAGDWTSNGNFQPASGTVIFDGNALQLISGPNVPWAGLTVRPFASVTTTQDVITTGALTVDGSLETTGTILQVGTDLNIAAAGNLVASGVPSVRVFGGITSLGTLSATSAVLDVDGNGFFGPASSTTIAGGTHTFSSGLETNGTLTVPSTSNFVFDGSGDIATNGSTLLPNVEIRSSGYGISGTVIGNLLQTAGAADLSLDNIAVQGNATFQGGTFSQLVNTSLDVEGDLAILTISPVTDVPATILSAGNWTTNGNFQPASGTVIFDGTAPQAITGPSIPWVNLVVRPSASVSTDQDVITTGALTVDGALTTTGTAFEVGTDLDITVAGSLSANGVPNLRVLGGLTSLGTLSAASAVLDVDGNGVFGPASSTTIADGSHTFSSGLETNGTLTVPSTSNFVFDGSGNIVTAGTTSLTNVEVTSSGYGIAATVTGDLLQTAGAADLSLGNIAVQGNATFEGGTFSQLVSTSLDVDGDLAIQTVSAVTDVPATILVAGNWTSNGNFQPASGTVVFDGSAPQSITGPDVPWANLVVSPSASVTTTQDVVTTGALTVDGTLDTTGTLIEVGTDLNVAGNLVANGAVTLRVVGGITSLGTLSATSAVLDVEGSVVFGPASSTTIADGSHTFFSGLESNGTLTVPLTSTFVFDGTGGIVTNGSTSLTNIEVNASGTVTTVGDVTVTGNFGMTAGDFGLGVGDSVTVVGDANLAGGTLSGAAGSVLDIEGDVTLDGTMAGVSLPTIRVAGDWTQRNRAEGLFQPLTGIVIFDGTYDGLTQQVIAGPNIPWASLAVAAGANVATNQDLITVGDLTIDGALSTTENMVDVGTNLDIGATGTLIADFVPNLRVSGRLTSLGTLRVRRSVLDVDGNVVFGPASTTTLDDGTHTFSSGLETNGTLSVTTASTFVFDGAGSSAADSASLIITKGSTLLPNVRITSSGYGIAADLAGNLLQTASAADLLILNTSSVQGNATFQGGTFSQIEDNASLVVEGDLAIQTISTVTDVPAAIQVAGDWLSNGNFQPASGTVIFDGSSEQTITRPNLPWAGLTVRPSASVTMIQDVITTGALTVDGTLSTTGTVLEVGMDLNIAAAGNLTADGALSLRVFGGITSLGTLSVASAVLDVGGNVVFGPASSTAIADGTHAFSSGLDGTGTLTVPPTSTFVFDGSGDIVATGSTVLPNVRVTSSGYGIGAALTGNLLQAVGATDLVISSATTVQGDATFQGGTFSQSAGTASLEVEGNVAIQTGSEVTDVPAAILVAGDWASDDNFKPASGTVIFDGDTSAQTVAAGDSIFSNLQVNSAAIVNSNESLDINGDLNVQGELNSMGPALTVDGDLIIGSTGTLTGSVATTHTVQGAILGTGFLTAPGTLVLTGTATLPGTGTYKNIVVNSSGTVTTDGDVTVSGSFGLTAGTFDLGSDDTVNVIGNATLAGGTLSGAAGSVLDLDGNVTLDGTAAGPSLPTVRVAGNWASNSTFSPASGVVVFDGTGTNTIRGLAPGSDPTFSNLQIETGERVVVGGITLNAQLIDIAAGARFSAGGQTVALHVDEINASGELAVGPGGTLGLHRPTSMTFGPSARLSVVGSSSAPAVIVDLSGGRYDLTIEGTLEASNFEFRGMDAGGVQILDTAVISDLRGGVFADGADDGVLLDIATNTALELRNLEFDNTVGAANLRNLRSMTTWPIQLVNFTGNLSGPVFEDDPNDLIEWLEPDQTQVSSFAANGAIGRVELTFTTTSEVDVSAFHILKSLSPSGPFEDFFSPIAPVGTSGAAYAFTDSSVVFPNKYYYMLEEEIPVGPRRALGSDSAAPFPAQVGDTLFVGPGGFADIGSAIAAASPGNDILVAAGTYPSFTLDKSLCIMSDGSGPVIIDTSLMPVVIENIPDTEPDLALYGLDIGNGLSPNGLEIQRSRNIIVLDDVTVNVAADATGLLVDFSRQVAVQRSHFSGSPAVHLRTNANVYLSDGTVDNITVEESTLTYVGVTPLVTVIGASFVNPRPGDMPRVDFPLVWQDERTTVMTVTGNPGDPWSLYISPTPGFTDLPGTPVDMVLLLNSGQLAFMNAGIFPASGTVQVPIVIPSAQAFWGRGWPVQLVTVNSLLTQGRLGNVRRFVILP